MKSYLHQLLPFAFCLLFGIGCELPPIANKPNIVDLIRTCPPPRVAAETLSPATPPVAATPTDPTTPANPSTPTPANPTTPTPTDPTPQTPANPTSPTNPSTPTVTLEIPTFDQKEGIYPYGTIITVVGKNMPNNAYLEVSVNGGTTWQASSGRVQLICSARICGRVRLDNSVSDVLCGSFQVAYKRVVFVGNSITEHGPAPDIGWNGSWGMAASAADKDYKSLLMANLKQRYPQAEYMLYRAVPFEQSYWTFDYAELDKILAFKPDLIIIRFGENVDDSQVNNRNFYKFYAAFLSKLIDNSSARVITTNSFWPQPLVNGVIRDVSIGSKLDMAKIDDLKADPTNTAKGIFNDEGVASHPSDKGMKAIADRIWKLLE